VSTVEGTRLPNTPVGRCSFCGCSVPLFYCFLLTYIRYLWPISPISPMQCFYRPVTGGNPWPAITEEGIWALYGHNQWLNWAGTRRNGILVLFWKPVRRSGTSTRANGRTQRTITARILVQRSARWQSLSVTMRQLSGRTEAEYYCRSHKSFLTKTVVIGRHRRRYLYLEIHQNQAGNPGNVDLKLLYARVRVRVRDRVRVRLCILSAWRKIAYNNLRSTFPG